MKKLEKMDFVELKMESGTGNRKMIVLTESGHRYCEEEIMPLIQAELDALAAFSEEERELLAFVDAPAVRGIGGKGEGVMGNKIIRSFYISETDSVRNAMCDYDGGYVSLYCN